MVREGGALRLSCSVLASPAPRVTWEKVGEDLSSPSLSVSGNTLTVRSARVEDRGMYLCQAENSAGSNRAIVILEVEPGESPTLEILTALSQTSRIHSNFKDLQDGGVHIIGRQRCW